VRSLPDVQILLIKTKLTQGRELILLSGTMDIQLENSQEMLLKIGFLYATLQNAFA